MSINLIVNINYWKIAQAVRVLQGGGLVAHATEGVWGLACDPWDKVAVARLLALKGRSVSQGLILIAHRSRMFGEELATLSEADHQRALESWPGAHTFVLPNVARAPWPHWITGGREGVAVRVPGHDQARALCAEFGEPLVSTSANPSGRTAAISELKVRAYFGSNVDFYLPGTVLEPGAASAIHDLISGRELRSRPTGERSA